MPLPVPHRHPRTTNRTAIISRMIGRRHLRLGWTAACRLLLARPRKATAQISRLQDLYVCIAPSGGTKSNSDRLSVCASQGWEGLMGSAITRLAIVAAVLCPIVLISFPSFPRTLGTVYKPQVVERALKSDRLTNAPAPAKSGSNPLPPLERASKRVPMGCDRAFSSMSAPQFSTLFGRCLA
jgi:hypothetical protein